MRATEALPRAEAPKRSAGKAKKRKRAVVASSVQGWVLPHLISYVESRGVNSSPIQELFGKTNLVKYFVQFISASMLSL